MPMRAEFEQGYEHPLDKLMERLRERINHSVLLEASLNPTEWLCTTGWHHRGQWFLEHQEKAETAKEALRLMYVHYGEE